MPPWTAKDIPPQAGRLALITGATGGLGYETALELARAGAQVILAGRNPAKGQTALDRIRAEVPKADIAFEAVDQASLASVADFAARIASGHKALDLLVNNAGVMALPQRQTTADGFETQFSVNYLSHFALTARLLPLLRQGRAARVVSLSSLAHRPGAIDFADLQGDARYSPNKAYAQSKLAMLMFALELERQSQAHGWGIVSNAAHPGWARTDLFANGPGARPNPFTLWGAAKLIEGPLSQTAAEGSLPTLYAATAPEAKGGAYYGPSGLFELKGPPAPARMTAPAQDAAAAARLWRVSEELTGVAFSGA